MEYLSNVITDEDIDKIHAGQFNVLCAPRGWGKTTFMFDDRIIELARAKKHILYLIHNKLTRNAIANNHKDKAIVFESKEGNFGWFDKRNKQLFSEKDEDLIHVMCYQTFAALLRREGNAWLDDIDLIIWDEFDDIKIFYEREVEQLKKILPNFSRERIVAILQEGRESSVINFVYQIKTFVLDPNRIKLLAISATPENAACYFKEYINYILEGKLEERYYAETTIYISNVVDAIKEGIIRLGRKYWCFCPYVTEGFRIEAVAKAYGFTTIVLWSETNNDWKHLLTEERKAALNQIRDYGTLPEQYDFVIVTAVADRSLNVYDTSFQDWICNSSVYEYIGQYDRARFEIARQYLLASAKGLVEFVQNGFPVDYYKWHTLDELRELIEQKPIYSRGVNKKKLASFNAARKEYGDLWESRKYGKSRITQYKLKSTATTMIECMRIT